MDNFYWEENLEKHIPSLRRYARALTSNKATADDLVQDCLERAWQKRDSWREGSNFRSWIFTIMHNLFINAVRREKVHQNYVNRTARDNDFINDQNHLMHDLEYCLSQLKPELKEIVLLAGLECMSYREISEVTSLPMGTVMSRLSRGRSELRELMSENTKPKLVSVK